MRKLRSDVTKYGLARTPHRAGLLAKYARQVGQANRGAVTHEGGADWPWFGR